MNAHALMLRLYSRLPPTLAPLAASARGYYLRSWRYGADAERLVDEALDREQWTPARWRVWQEDTLARLLHRAATRVPYYRALWAGKSRHGSGSWENIANWPILTKADVRENPAAFVADDCDIRRMFQEHTSGTTGQSLDLWWSQATVRQWYGLFEARCRRWYGVSRHDRWAILGGQLVARADRNRPPFWVWNAGLNQLYMSSYHLAPDLIPHYLEALRRYEVTYLWGYSSSLYELARAVRDNGARPPRLRVAITNAEPLFPHQRQVIEQAFQCPVRETYGMAEIVADASECEKGILHLWPEVGWVEVLSNGVPATHGRGELVCTGLLNADMPLIRYRIGDSATVTRHGAERVCPCGRHLPTIASIEGRADDTLVTADGRRVGRLDPVFKSHMPIVEAQIVQDTLDRVTVRYVPARDFTSACAQQVIDEIRARLGPVEVIMEPTARIPRGANGKFRAVISRVASSPELNRGDSAGAPPSHRLHAHT
jgi:phenylacetate-CoA ligase